MIQTITRGGRMPIGLGSMVLFALATVAHAGVRAHASEPRVLHALLDARTVAPTDRSSSASSSAARGDTPPPGTDALRKLEDAKAQLARASELRSAMRGTEGDQRKTTRDAAVRAYRAVRDYFPDDTGVWAEASFRAGELLRSGGDATAALAEFQHVRERGGDSPFRVRAVVEIGHVQRRGKHYQDALSAYEAVLADAAASRRQKDDVSLWLGSVYADLDRAEDARRAWQRVADAGEDPLDRVRAFDQLASAAVSKGDLEGAAGVLDRCREALADAAAEETKLGERVRTALAGMHAHDELQKAVADRARAKEATPRARAKESAPTSPERKSQSE